MNGMIHIWSYIDIIIFHVKTQLLLQKKMMLLTHHDGMLPESAYYLTHNSLRQYTKDLEKSFYNRFSIIPNGTEFKTIGYYLPIFLGSGNMQYFLIESLDSNKTKAWIHCTSFDIKKCYPE